MLSEEEAIIILESNNMKPSIRQLGNQKKLITKLINGYSFIVTQDESNPGYLCAFLNHPKNGVVITWNEIDYQSLSLAIKNVQALLKIKSKSNLITDRQLLIITITLLSVLISTGYIVGTTVVSYCSNQRPEIPLSKP
ncbi:hypothetical protein VB735_03575 [Halotia wernerae UHCC 0503]|nr:hypothetical protein [Halotia wernerae UHCC 0503]